MEWIFDVIEIGQKGVYYDSIKKKLISVTVTAYNVSYHSNSRTQTTTITYYCDNGYIFTNVIEELKLTDLFKTADDFYSAKNYLLKELNDN